MDPFARQARQYALSRPRYPSELLSRLVSRVPLLKTATCLDVGCGSGQLTVQLADEGFQSVLGVDRSAPQLKNAHKHERVRYEQVQDATHMSTIESEGFDCVTVAQTLHWLPITQALQEFNRVLKPGGVFAALGYGVCNIENNPDAQKVFRSYYESVLGSCLPLGDPKNRWECDRTRLDSGHAAESFTPPFEHIERMWHKDSRTIQNQEFLDYLTTWSAYQLLLKTLPPGAVDPLQEIRDILYANGRQEVTITFPFWMVIGSKPRRVLLSPKL